MDFSPPSEHRSLSMHYFSNQSLRLALWEQWTVGESGAFENYSATAAREFRYDSLRARYLFQDYNTNGSPSVEEWDTDGLSPMHTDYAGESAYLDGELSDPGGNGNFVVNGQSRYFGGSGQETLDPQGTGNVLSRRYFHGDLIDSNVMTTNENGVAQATTAYTAFGEAISWHAGAASPSLPDDPEALGTRYQYAGQWGYEAPTAIDYAGGGGGAPYSQGPGLTLRGVNPNLPPITLSHVGARWYQPGVGRFVQRDPIGLFGGANCYAYCLANPNNQVDPTGLDVYGGDWDDPLTNGLAAGWRWLLGDPVVRNLSDGQVIGISCGTGVAVGTGIGIGVLKGGVVLVGAGSASRGGCTVEYRLAGTKSWLYGAAGRGITSILRHGNKWKPWFWIPFPVPFAGSGPGLFGTARGDCISTAFWAVARGWWPW